MSTIAILGSSGNVGAAIIKYLAANAPTATIVAGVRDPASAKAKELLSHGSNVKLVASDLGTPASLAAATTGADVIFVNVPGAENRTELALNGIEAAKAAKPKHLVVLSVHTAELQGTVFGRQFAPIEAATKASGIPYTLLRLPVFIDNNWGQQATIKSQGKLYGPANPQALFNPIAVSDIGIAFGTVLANPAAHVNKTYIINSAATSNAATAAAFSKATGKQVDYVQVPYAAAKQSFIGAGWPEWQVIGLLELFGLFDADSRVTHNDSTDFKTITGKDAITTEQWIAQVGAAFA